MGCVGRRNAIQLFCLEKQLAEEIMKTHHQLAIQTAWVIIALACVACTHRDTFEGDWQVGDIDRQGIPKRDPNSQAKILSVNGNKCVFMHKELSCTRNNDRLYIQIPDSDFSLRSFILKFAQNIDGKYVVIIRRESDDKVFIVANSAEVPLVRLKTQ